MFLAPKLNIQIVTGKERSVATELTTAFNSKTYSVVKCFLQNYSGAPRGSIGRGGVEKIGSIERGGGVDIWEEEARSLLRNCRNN